MYTYPIFITVYFFLLLCTLGKQQYDRALNLTLFSLYTWNLVHVFIPPTTNPDGPLMYVTSDLFGVVWDVLLCVIFTLVSVQLRTPRRYLPYFIFIAYLAWGVLWVSFAPDGVLQRQLWYPSGLLLALYLFCTFRRTQITGEVRVPLLPPQDSEGGPILWEKDTKGSC